jgi:hypothetical protein
MISLYVTCIMILCYVRGTNSEQRYHFVVAVE